MWRAAATSARETHITAMAACGARLTPATANGHLSAGSCHFDATMRRCPSQSVTQATEQMVYPAGSPPRRTVGASVCPLEKSKRQFSKNEAAPRWNHHREAAVRWRSTMTIMAEKEGFEPSRQLSHPTPLAGEPLRPLGYFSTSIRFWRRERDSNPRCLSTSLVFKTSALNRSAISPRMKPHEPL